MITRRDLSALALALAAAPAMAQQDAAFSDTARKAGRSKIRGRDIAWTSEAGELVLHDETGAPRATMSAIAYLETGADAAKRPVTFLFNGGPGSATIALHEGLAPKITASAKGKPGFRVVDNPDSILDITDLVFVDAPGTGYGRFFGEGVSKDYWGVEEDGRAFAAFVHQWLTDHDRLASPRFVVGESYGGARAAFLAQNLIKARLPLTGVVLVSPSTSAGERNLLRQLDDAASGLPTQAAVAWFHKRGAYTAQPVEEVAEQARAYAVGPLSAALAKGDDLPDAEKAEVAEKLSGFTGLSPQVLLKHDLRIGSAIFVNELLADKGERIGLLDGRAHAPRAITDKRQPPYNDPSTSPYTLTYDQTTAVESYWRGLGYAPQGAYTRLSMDANRGWNKKVVHGSVSMPLMFREIMAGDQRLKITMVTGYYDLTLPYYGMVADYAASWMPPGRFTSHTYRSGHGVFSEDATRVLATDRLREFYASALAG